MLFRKISYHRNPTPPQANIPILSENKQSTARFRQEGLSFNDIPDIVKQVCTEIYFRPLANGRIFRGGLPIGGKASAKLANLYGCAIECAYRDELVNEGRMGGSKKLVQSMAIYRRYARFWRAQMGRNRTGATPCTTTSEAVFLDMRIRSNPTRIPNRNVC